MWPLGFRWPWTKREAPKVDHNAAVSRYVVLNETGNVLLATTAATGEVVPENAQQVFSEACAHLAAIMRAISSTRRPEGDGFHSVFDSQVLLRLLDRHPLFVHMHRESIEITGAPGKTLLTNAVVEVFGIGLPTRDAQRMAAVLRSMAMVTDRVGMVDADEEARVGHLMLICESLLGVPVVSAVLTHLSLEHCRILAGHTGDRAQEAQPVIALCKEVYLFVSPAMAKTLTNSVYYQV